MTKYKITNILKKSFFCILSTTFLTTNILYYNNTIKLKGSNPSSKIELLDKNPIKDEIEQSSPF